MSKFKPNGAYIQSFKWLMCRKEISHSTKVVYCMIYECGKETGNFYPSNERLAVLCAMNPRKVREHVAKLVKLRLISVSRPDRNLNNNYTFLDHPWMHVPLPFSKEYEELQAKTNQAAQLLYNDDEPDRPKTASPDRPKTASRDRPKTASPYITKKYKQQSNNKTNVHSEVNKPKKCSGAPLRIVHSTTSNERENFEHFWKEYPRKQNKQVALKVWTKAKLDKVIDQILMDLQVRKETAWKDCKKKYIPLPSTYLNSEAWLDDPEELKSSVDAPKFDAARKLDELIEEEQRSKINKLFGSLGSGVVHEG